MRKQILEYFETSYHPNQPDWNGANRDAFDGSVVNLCDPDGNPVPKNETAFVYVFKVNDFVKVGLSRNVLTRRKAIQHACPYPVDVSYYKRVFLTSCRAVEGNAHSRLYKYRVRGEWFECTPKRAINAVNAAIKEACKWAPMPEPSKILPILSPMESTRFFV